MVLCFELIHIFTSFYFVFCVSIDFRKPSNWNTAYIGRHELRHSEASVANVCVRYKNRHLFSCDCCLVFTTSLRKPGIYFTGIHTRCSLMYSRPYLRGLSECHGLRVLIIVGLEGHSLHACCIQGVVRCEYRDAATKVPVRKYHGDGSFEVILAVNGCWWLSAVL